MSIVQWLLLILVVAVVGGAYWYLRRASESDPWHGMEDPEAADDALERGEALGGDSYIVGVRTIARETPADRKAAAQAQRDLEAQRRTQEDSTPPSPIRAFRKSPTKPAPPPSESMSKPLPEHDAGEREAPRQDASYADSFEDAQEIPRRSTERVEMCAPGRQSEHSQIFVLHVAARRGEMFDGPAIHEALADANLKFGLNDIYHRVTEERGVTESVYAVANMLKPGTLDPVDQDHLTTAGLTMFLLVPGALEGRPAMRDMMETANYLATTLGGQVLDDKRALLKAQTAQFMLDEIADVDRRVTVAARRR